MRIAIVSLVLVALGATAVFLFLQPGGTPDVGDGDSLSRPERQPGSGNTELRGTGVDTGASVVPHLVRGGSTIQGTVTLAGDGVEAVVELRLLQSLRGAAPGAGLAVERIVHRLLHGGTALSPPLVSTRSDGDGRFAIRGLGAGWYEIAAIHADAGSVRTSVVILTDGANAAARLELPMGSATLRGRVVYTDGSRFVGWVVVEAADTTQSVYTTAPGARVVSVGEDGRFTIGGLPPTVVRLSAVVPGVLRVMDIVTLPREDEFLLSIDPDRGTRSGRVLSALDDAPISGAVVFVGHRRASRSEMRSATTDDAGRFGLPDQPGADLVLVATAQGYAPRTVYVTDEEGTPIEMRLERAARVSGRVLAEGSRAPVAHIQVYAVPLDPNVPLLLPSSARADASGRFVLEGIVPGSVALFALGAGYASPDLAEARADGFNSLARSLDAGASEEIELLVHEAGHVEGRVVTTDGRAVPGAVVQVEKLPLMDPLAALPGAGGESAVTDAEGHYRLETLAPGVPSFLTLTAAGHAPTRSELLHVASGETKRLDFALPLPRWLELEVQGPDGRPAAGAQVAVAGPEGDGGGLGVALVGATDAHGRVRLGPLHPGQVLVAVEAPVGLLDVEAWHPLKGTDGEGDMTKRLVLEAGISLSGSMVVPEGAPAASIEAHVQGGKAGRFVWEDFTVADDGTWRLDGLPEGCRLAVTATLLWEGRSWKGEAQTTTGSSDVVVVLEPELGAARIAVRVLDAEGRPVPTGPIRMRIQSKTWASSHRATLSSGRAVFDRGDPRTPGTELWFVLGPFGEGAWAATVAGPFDGTSDEEIEIRLSPGRTVSGRVVDARGAGVGGIRVTASPTRDDLPPGTRGALGAAHSTPDGAFEIRGLGTEAHVLEIDVPSRYLAPEAVVVEPPKAQIVLRLRDALAVKFQVFDPDGAPVSGALVKAHFHRPGDAATATAETSGDTPWPADVPPPGQDLRVAVTDASGTATLPGLDPDAAGAVLQVRPPEESPDLLAFGPVGWTPADTTVRLVRGLFTVGVVRDGAGRAMPDATVSYGIVGSEARSTAVVASDGSFRVGPLPPGEIELVARVGSGPEGPLRRVRVGAEGVVLEVDPGLALRLCIEPFPGPVWVQVNVRSEEAVDPVVLAQGLDPEGRVRFVGLRPGVTYTVWMHGLEGGRYVLASGLEAGGAERTLTPRVGRTIEGRFDLPSDAQATWKQLTAQVLGFLAHGVVTGDGTFLFEGLPEGTWTLTAIAGTDAAWSAPSWHATVEARTGRDDVRIELVPIGE